MAGPDPLVILDVREHRERQIGVISVPAPSVALHVPMNEVPARLEEIRNAAAGHALVVYCHHGVRSAMVGGWLLGQGFENVDNLDGGIDAWSTNVDPTVARY